MSRIENKMRTPDDPRPLSAMPAESAKAPRTTIPVDPFDVLRHLLQLSEDSTNLESNLAATLRRLDLAQQLDVEALTTIERAERGLSRACNGWRTNRHCTNSDGSARLAPHPACLRAQLEHDRILDEHGLLPPVSET